MSHSDEESWLVKQEIRRTGEEIRRVKEEIAQIMAELAKMSARATSESRPVPEVRNSRYLREKSDDYVLQAYADVIERNEGIWEGIKQLMTAGIDLSDYGLRDYRVTTTRDVGFPQTTEVIFTLIDTRLSRHGR